MILDQWHRMHFINKTISSFCHRYQDFAGQYFGSGWAFFLPYLFLYLLFWTADWPIQTLTAIFYCLHFIHAIGIFHFGCLKFQANKWRTALFWAALASLFFNTGTYLEFPSDPWEHFWRISQWQNIEKISDATANYKFAYFFGYTLIGWTEPSMRLIALDFYFTFWSLLLALQFYRLALKSSIHEPWAKLAVVGTILLMGNSSFGFYRYYGISSTMLSTIAFLAGIVATIDYARSKKISFAIPVGFSLLVSILNHPQGILLYLAATIGILLHALINKLGWKYFILKILSILCLVAILFHFLLDSSWFEGFFKSVYPIWASGDWLYPWGGFKLFSFDPQINNGSGRFLQITGVLGCINLVIATFYAQKKMLVGWITISPIIFLLYPPFAIPFAYLFDGLGLSNIRNIQRVLLAIPQGFCLVMLLQNVSQNKREVKFLDSKILIPLSALALILLSLNPSPHFFGRFQQAFLKTPQTLSLRTLAETSQILFESLALEKDQYILSDTTTQFVISSHLGSKEKGYRHAAENLKSRINSLGGTVGILQKPEIAGVLALAKQPELNSVGSILGKASGHWHPQTVRNNLRFISSLEHELDSLIEHGWEKTAVAPWYNLYLRPR